MPTMEQLTQESHLEKELAKLNSKLAGLPPHVAGRMRVFMEKVIYAKGMTRTFRELASLPPYVAMAVGMLLQERLDDYEEAWDNGKEFPSDASLEEIIASLGIREAVPSA